MNITPGSFSRLGERIIVGGTNATHFQRPLKFSKAVICSLQSFITFLMVTGYLGNIQQNYSVFQRFRQAKFAYGEMILRLSQFSLLPKNEARFKSGRLTNNALNPRNLV